jgi:hypothetical protein
MKMRKLVLIAVLALLVTLISLCLCDGPTCAPDDPPPLIADQPGKRRP